MDWWRKKVTMGQSIQLCPVILQARAILALADTSKRKSEWQVVDPNNKTILTNPSVDPRLFLECEIARKYWGSGPKTIIIDIENYDVYKNITGTTYKQVDGLNSHTYKINMYLKKVATDDGGYIKPSTITNLDYVLKLVLGDKKEE